VFTSINSFESAVQVESIDEFLDTLRNPAVLKPRVVSNKVLQTRAQLVEQDDVEEQDVVLLILQREQKRKLTTYLYLVELLRSLCWYPHHH
jgi:hypothetical protein